MRAIIGFVVMFLGCSAVSAQPTEVARMMVGYLNGELVKTYKAMSIHDEKCADETCVYRLTKTAFLEITGGKQIERIRLVANIETSPTATDFSEDLKAATYLYSLILWGNLPTSAAYDDANRFLRHLIDRSSSSGAAVASTNNWTYGIVHTKCFGPSTMLVAIRTLSAASKDVGETPALCRR